jgi:hypothetical protein
MGLALDVIGRSASRPGPQLQAGFSSGFERRARGSRKQFWKIPHANRFAQQRTQFYARTVGGRLTIAVWPRFVSALPISAAYLFGSW